MVQTPLRAIADRLTAQAETGDSAEAVEDTRNFMKTTLGNLSLDRKLTGSYRRLFSHLGLLILAVVILSAAIVVYFDRQHVETLSRKLISRTAEKVMAQLAAFLETEDSNLRIAVEQLQTASGLEGLPQPDLFYQLSPFLNHDQNASGILLTALDGDGAYYGILKPDPEASAFIGRVSKGTMRAQGQAKLERWKDGELLETWSRRDDFEPRKRPWYEKTLKAEENEIVASGPYLFHTSNKPGITISTRWRQRNTGQRFILAIDIVLSNIARFTQTLRPTPNGIAFVITPDLRLVGLPALERFNDDRAAEAALLEPLTASAFPLLHTGVAAWEKLGRTRQSFTFKMDGQTWWAGFEWIEGHPHHAGFLTGVLVPETDFLGTLPLQRNFALAAAVGPGLMLALILILFTMRKMRHEVRQAVSYGGQKLGPFELSYKIGHGGNGTVYRANHALLKRPTAIKVMLPQFARHESAKKRFISEVQLTSNLTHPNTVAIFDFGETPEGTLYYAMEHLNGANLEELVGICGPQSAARVVHILQQVCGSLGEAHRKGLIHRDIKPANIMLCERGGLYDVVKVLDFGLVQDRRQVEPHSNEADDIVGTPFYLAPELIAKASAFSPQSDLYALGAVAYYLLTGRNVFEGANTVEICAMHLHDEPVPPSQHTNRHIPPDLETIVMSCLAKQPADRPQGAEAMITRLSACQDNGAWDQERARKWWSENRGDLPVEGREQTHPPLSNTHRLVFTDARQGRF